MKGGAAIIKANDLMWYSEYSIGSPSSNLQYLYESEENSQSLLVPTLESHLHHHYSPFKS